jgi:hypothetical protein
MIIAAFMIFIVSYPSRLPTRSNSPSDSLVTFRFAGEAFIRDFTERIIPFVKSSSEQRQLYTLFILRFQPGFCAAEARADVIKACFFLSSGHNNFRWPAEFIEK